ncbi:hypothetical protein GE09DRAFT_211920 [Coniochaeta sp. 2T2.1]|nr:hypothetical protein GE09DRAFT_211920 [Coniochaeta sp. 2T2.1]
MVHSWRKSAIAALILCRRTVVAQSACAQSTITVTAAGSLEAALTDCATVANGAKTLNHSLRIDHNPYTLGDDDLGYVNLTGIEVILGLVELVIYAIPSDDLDDVVLFDIPPISTIHSSTLRNVTGAIRIGGVIDSSDTAVGSVILDLPKLEFLESLYLEAQLDGLDVRLGPNLTVDDVRVSNTRAVESRLDVGRPGRFLYFNNTTPKPGTAVLSSNMSWAREGVEMTANVGLRDILLTRMEYARLLQVVGNPDLETLEPGVVAVQLVNVTGNGPKTAATFARLQSIGVVEASREPYESSRNAHFGELTALNLPALEETVGPVAGLYFTNNTFLGLQLPSLSSVNGTLTIDENQLLFDIGLPRLESVAASLVVRGNPQLLNFTANVLKRALSVQMRGEFTNVELFSLEDVSGSFDLAGGPSMDCSWFDDHFPGTVVKGRYSCVGNHTHPPKPRRPSTSTPSEEVDPMPTGHARGLSIGAKAGVGVGAAVGALLLIGVGVWAFRRRWGSAERPGGPDAQGKPELDGAGIPGSTLAEESVEADGSELQVGELPTSRLGDATGRSELPVPKRKPVELW